MNESWSHDLHPSLTIIVIFGTKLQNVIFLLLFILEDACAGMSTVHILLKVFILQSTVLRLKKPLARTLCQYKILCTLSCNTSIKHSCLKQKKTKCLYLWQEQIKS